MEYIRIINRNRDWLLLAIILFIPFYLWLINPIFSYEFYGFGNIQSAIARMGELAGILGSVLFAFSLLISTRLHLIEYFFNGLNNLYRRHSTIGQIALVLLLVHPFLLLSRYATSLREASSFLLLSDNWNRNFGILALWGMLGLIILTLFLRPKYNIWKWTHKFMGFAFFLGALHIYLIPSSNINDSNLLLKYYVLGFAVIGLTAYIYKTVLGKFFVKKYKFSITSAPDENDLRITVKVLGDYTKKLVTNLRVGECALLQGPFGNFSYKINNRKQLWIAGGIGITPYISFIRDIINGNNYTGDIILFYAVRNVAEAVYLNFLETVSLKNNFFKVIPFYSNNMGYLSSEYLVNNVGDIRDRDIFICAPPAMIQDIKNGLVLNKIDKADIHSEEFAF